MRVVTRYYRVSFPGGKLVKVPHTDVIATRKGHGLARGRTPHWIVVALAAKQAGLSRTDGKVVSADM